MATLHHPDGRTEEVRPQDPRRGLTLDDFHRIIGPEIDFVYGEDGMALIVDDRGMIKRLPINDAATRIYQRWGGITPIHGAALHCCLHNPGRTNERWD